VDEGPWKWGGGGGGGGVGSVWGCGGGGGGGGGEGIGERGGLDAVEPRKTAAGAAGDVSVCGGGAV